MIVSGHIIAGSSDLWSVLYRHVSAAVSWISFQRPSSVSVDTIRHDVTGCCVRARFGFWSLAGAYTKKAIDCKYRCYHSYDCQLILAVRANFALFCCPYSFLPCVTCTLCHVGCYKRCGRRSGGTRGGGRGRAIFCSRNVSSDRLVYM